LKALNDPIKGITALSRVGVSFTQQQKDQIKAMQDAGNTAGAQAIILAELTKEFGGSAAAAGKDFGGQLIILKNNLIDAGESIGLSLMPKLLQFSGFIIDHMPQIQAFIQKAGEVITTVFKEIAEYVQNTLVPKFQQIVTVVTQIAQKLFPEMGKSGSSLGDIMKDLTTKALNITITALTWIRDNLPIIKGAAMLLTGVLAIHTGIVLGNNIAIMAGNVQMGIKKALDLLATGQIIALYIAQGISTAATWAGAAAQGAFNLAMSMNPIGAVILALVALGAGIAVVVTHWKDICTWMEKAWNWLNTWNKTPMKNKDGTVTQTVNTVKTGNAKGTEYWQGGLTHVNELGGEIMDLPQGTRIIPHDVSMEMAKNGNQKKTQNINYYGPVYMRSDSEDKNNLQQMQYMAAM
jgi:hypothetical protein